MSNIASWSPIAGNNSNPPPNGAPENMPRNTVNNTMREMMAACARLNIDQSGSIVATGTGQPYSITSSGSLAGTPYTSYDQISIICFRANITCPAAPTLVVDGLGSGVPLVFDAVTTPEAGDIPSTTIVVAQYNPASARFEMLNQRQRAVAVGTRMLFQQSAVPPRWTKIVTFDDMALRVVSGNVVNVTNQQGMSVVFTAKTITQANLPNVTLAQTGSGLANLAGAHLHTYTRNNNTVSNISGSGINDNLLQSTQTSNTSTSLDHTHTVTGVSVSLGGSGTPIDFGLNQIDVVIGQAL